MCPHFATAERVHLIESVTAHSTEQNLDREFFLQHIAHETYLDIMQVEGLRAFIVACNHSESQEVRLRHLPGIATNQHRVLGAAGVIRDPIDLALRVAEINAEVVMASINRNADIQTSAGAEHLLKAKVLRAGLRSSLEPGFLCLAELAHIPDIGLAVEAGDLTLSDIWVIRKKNSARQFRKWLQSLETCDSRELEQCYVEAIGRKYKCSTLPIRVLRMCGVTAASTLLGLTGGPVAGFVSGLALAAADNYFVDHWLRGYSPRLFMDEIHALPVANTKGLT
jgi:hypothetical protein